MKILSIFFALVSLFLVFPVSILAQTYERGSSITLGQNQVVNNDYFAAGNTITLNGTVNGDAYVAGGNITVDGTVNGDLLAAGGNIDIRGNITGNIRAAGGNINIASTVGRNTSVAGGNIDLSQNANITGNFVTAAGQVNIAGKVRGDTNAATGMLALAPSAKVSGNLTYLSQNNASISKGATVSGKITHRIPEGRQTEKTAGQGFFNFLIFFTVADFILTAIIGILLILFFPVYFEKTSQIATKRFWASLGIGILAIIITPFVAFLLFITVIGIPVALFLIFLLMVFSYLAKIFIAFTVGQIILRRYSQNSKILQFLLGLVVYFIFTIIPFVGWIIAAIAMFVGLGAILIEDKDIYQDLRAKQII